MLLFPVLLTELCQKDIGQEEYVSPSLSQRRNGQRNRIEPEIQIRSQTPFRNGFLQIEIRCRNKPES